ncbi:hypothetical protein HDF18_23040 [Mucilaginibacter sp. X5P1]|uniref:hypothetical protein n=1 Tax=Mucilaginibacter sp. X5P1 TaxID=2723088 RepID=UPI001607CAB5|nr:hypothetical protein [Mucilaginibacter sp. X5P1]MBB6141162.1 hypothetical protein [Mucilaginibacter sp. X5P1]
MKKILFLLLISGALLASSCTKNYAVVPNVTTNYTLPATDWTTTDNGLNYTATIPAKGGNLGAASDGLLIYFTFDNGQSYEQIPEVYNNVSFTYTNDGNNLTLYAQSANAGQTIPAPVALTVKIVAVPSN